MLKVIGFVFEKFLLFLEMLRLRTIVLFIWFIRRR